MNYGNATQFIPESEMAVIEAEALVTNLSMKLHRASRLAVAARERKAEVEKELSAHVRVSSLPLEELARYYQQRELLSNSMWYAYKALVNAEDAEASVEVEWEQAVQHLANLLQ